MEKAEHGKSALCALDKLGNSVDFRNLTEAGSILALLALKGVGRTTARRVLFHASQPASIESLSSPDLPDSVRDPAAVSEAYEYADEVLQKSKANGIRTLTIFDQDYPAILRSIDDPPLLLHTKGDTSLLTHWPAVAIIGTREPTPYGERSARRIAKTFAEHQISVVSGLAIGCDAAAHRGCLDGEGRTVAVLAHGLDSIYPAENRELADDILSHSGCLVSEYEIGLKPMRNSFVDRNRLQSGFAGALVLIEASVSSGSMHTVRFAQKQKRLIACVQHPERYDQEQIQGNRKLLEEHIAIPLATAEDVLGVVNRLRAMDPAALAAATSSSDRAANQSSMF